MYFAELNLCQKSGFSAANFPLGTLVFTTALCGAFVWLNRMLHHRAD